MSTMLALITVAVLTSTERSANASGGGGFTDAIGLPPWVYTVGGAVVFLGMLAVTFAFRSTGKRH